MNTSEKSPSPNKFSLDPIPSFAHIHYAPIYSAAKLQVSQGTHR